MMSDYFLETKRLFLKKISEDDFDDVAQMLKNPEVMYAWEHEFTDKDVTEWIQKCKQYYDEYGYAYFLAIDKSSKKVVGQVALLQDEINGKNYIEVGYILKKEYWGKGYAKEGALALINYAFNELKSDEVIAEIRPSNINSRSVAESLGMKVTGEFQKNVRGKMMIHLIYSLYRPSECQ